MLLIVQPWFSVPGHHAHYTLLNLRALSRYIPVKSLIYISGNDPGIQSLKEKVATFSDLEIVTGDGSDLRLIIRATYMRLRTLVANKPDISHVWFLDVSLNELLRLLMRYPLKRRVQITVFEVWGAWPAEHSLKSWMKRWLLRRIFARHNMILAVRTQELAISWQQSGWVPATSCVAPPTLELTEPAVNSDPLKLPASTRNELVFVIAGQLGKRKNIPRIASLFSENRVSGSLRIAGELPHGARLEDMGLQQIASEIHPSITFEQRFLSEVDLCRFVGSAHYNLLTYVDWDERMESGMLYTSARLGTPVVGKSRGWMARVITDYNLGYVVNPEAPDELCHCLQNCALPGSAEYTGFQSGMRRMLDDYRTENVAPKLLDMLGLPH